MATQTIEVFSQTSGELIHRTQRKYKTIALACDDSTRTVNELLPAIRAGWTLADSRAYVGHMSQYVIQLLVTR